MVMDKPVIENVDDIIVELEKIASSYNTPKIEATFALALLYLLYKIGHPQICKDFGI